MEDAEAQWRREERYRSVINVMTEGMVLQIAGGTIVDCNEQATRILGQTRNQILGRTSRDSHWRAVREDGSPFPGEEHPAMITLKTGQPCRQIVMGLHLPKGILRWICINAEPLFWDGKIKPAAVVTTFSDITERKRIETTLQESNALFSLFMQHSPIFAYIKEVTPDASRVLFASDNFREMVGIPGSAMQGKTMAELFPAELAANFVRDDQTVVAKGEVLRVEEEFDGRHYATVKFPIIHNGKSLLAGYTIDITERKRAEDALRASEARWKFAIEGAGDGLWDWDVPANLVFYSQRWKEMLGYAVDEIGSSVEEWSRRVRPEDLPQAMAAVNAHFDGQTASYVNEHRVCCKDGSWKWILARGLVISRDAAGKPLRVIGTHSDITERKRLEAQTGSCKSMKASGAWLEPSPIISTTSWRW